jgi:hypothetical protein
MEDSERGEDLLCCVVHINHSSFCPYLHSTCIPAHQRLRGLCMNLMKVTKDYSEEKKIETNLHLWIL